MLRHNNWFHPDLGVDQGDTTNNTDTNSKGFNNFVFRHFFGSVIKVFCQCYSDRVYLWRQTI